MLELNLFAPIRPRKPQGPFMAVKLNKGFTDCCHNNFVIVGFNNNLEGLAGHQLISESARDPPPRTD